MGNIILSPHPPACRQGSGGGGGPCPLSPEASMWPRPVGRKGGGTALGEGPWAPLSATLGGRSSWRPSSPPSRLPLLVPQADRVGPGGSLVSGSRERNPSGPGLSVAAPQRGVGACGGPAATRPLEMALWAFQLQTSGRLPIFSNARFSLTTTHGLSPHMPRPFSPVGRLWPPSPHTRACAGASAQMLRGRPRGHCHPSIPVPLALQWDSQVCSAWLTLALLCISHGTYPLAP